MPIQTLNIDRRSFVWSYSGDPAWKEAVFKNIVSMEQILIMTVVADSSETESDWALLKTFGYDDYQGYYFLFTLTADEFRQRWHDSAESPERQPEI